MLWGTLQQNHIFKVSNKVIQEEGVPVSEGVSLKKGTSVELIFFDLGVTNLNTKEPCAQLFLKQTKKEV